jgi:uncharacterized protein YbjT (DUF2867 family)
MNNSKTIFVTGGTGNQGGAVAKNLLQNGFKVKVLTRDPESASAQNLKKLNAEIIKGDLDMPGTFSSHLKDVNGIFSVQSSDNVKKEIKQGIALADVAKQNNIRHFVYTSLAPSEMHTGIPHFESKLVIEKHIKSISIPYTIIRPSELFENFLIPMVKKGILKGKLTSPFTKSVLHQYTSADDVGKTSVKIFSDPDKYIGQIITLATDEMNLSKAAEIFSGVLGKPVKYQQLPLFIVRIVMGKNLYMMFKYINKNGGDFIKDLDAIKNQNPNLTGLKEWAVINFKK